MNPLIRGLFLVVLTFGQTEAQERPSWAVIDAVDRLIARNALFMPGRDGFAKLPNGTLTQYELPTKNYLHEGKAWKVELMSPRWRKKQQGTWSAWVDARPQYGAWRIGLIRVDVLASGVSAKWVENTNFSGTIAPGEAEVTQKLDTQGQRTTTSQVASSHSTPVHTVSPAAGSTSSIRRSPPIFQRQTKASNRLPAGMSRAVAPSGQASSQVHVPKPPIIPRRLVPGPAMPSAIPEVAKTAATPPPERSWRGIIGLLTVIAAACAFLNSKRLGKRSGNRGTSRKQRATTPPLPASTTAGKADPVHLIKRKETLMTAAEQAFFDVLEPLVRSSCRVSSNVRLLDLFEIRQEPGRQAAFNKISRKHIDFVLTENATSRILCAIELDDSSHNRPDRIERDDFVNELFVSQSLPLLRVPFAWTYNVPGLRAELVKAGVSLPAAA